MGKALFLIAVAKCFLKLVSTPQFEAQTMGKALFLNAVAKCSLRTGLNNTI